MAEKITKENFKELVLESDRPVLLDFFATWCGPCQMVAPIVEEIAVECAEITVGKIDVDEQGELAAAFGVESIPTLVVVKGGRVTAQKVGYAPKDAILAMLQQ